MDKSKFLKSGHFPTLIAAFLYFDVSFMVWVLLGPLAPFLGEHFRLTATQKGLLTAIPLLGGSLFRPLLGVLGDRLGGRKAGLLGLGLTLIPLLLGWRFAHTPGQFYSLGLLLGISGASFAVALPLAGRWYPPEYQGLVMGIAGAGNSGTLVATLLAPRLAQKFGFANAFALAILPILLVLLLFAVLAKDSPRQGQAPAWSDFASVLREADTAWFCFFYCFTFGGFVGFASFLTVFFSRSIRPCESPRGRLHHDRCACGKFPPAGRRMALGQNWRLSPALDSSLRLVCKRRCGGHRAAFDGRSGAALRHDGNARHGQRRCFSAPSSALSRTHRHSHGLGGRRRRFWRIPPPISSRSHQGSDGAILNGVVPLRGCVFPGGRHSSRVGDAVALEVAAVLCGSCRNFLLSPAFPNAGPGKRRMSCTADFR